MGLLLRSRSSLLQFVGPQWEVARAKRGGELQLLPVSWWRSARHSNGYTMIKSALPSPGKRFVSNARSWRRRRRLLLGVSQASWAGRVEWRRAREALSFYNERERAHYGCAATVCWPLLSPAANLGLGFQMSELGARMRARRIASGLRFVGSLSKLAKFTLLPLFQFASALEEEEEEEEEPNESDL